MLGAGLLALVHRFPNVVLWLNGHTHANSVQARRNPDDPARGFWEVTTCAVIDWPCQTRIVELVNRGECLSIVCTMVDHDTQAGARFLEAGSSSLNTLAGGAISGTSADQHHHSAGAGTAADRNVELRIAAPFPLGRLGRGLSDQCRQPEAVNFSIAVSLPSSLTCAAAVRPSAQRVNSAGLPVTVTTGVLALAVIRTRCGPDPRLAGRP